MASDLDHKGLGHALVLAIGGKPKDDDEDAGSSDSSLKAAADAVFDAGKGDDKDAFAEALHTYVKLCAMGSSDDDES